MAAPYFVRVRRLTRQPLRLGTTNITNLTEGSVVDLNSRLVQNDMFRFNGRWMVVSPVEAGFADGTSPVMDPALATATLAPATQLFVMTGVKLPKGLTINSLTYYSRAAGTPTLNQASIWTSDGTNFNRQAISVDNGAAAVSADSPTAFTFTVPYVTPAAGTYYFGYLCVGTPQTLVGRTPAPSAIFANLGVTGGRLFSQLAAQATTPAGPLVIASNAQSTHVPFVTVA